MLSKCSSMLECNYIQTNFAKFPFNFNYSPIFFYSYENYVKISNTNLNTLSNRCKRLSQFLDLLNIPRHHSGHSGSSSSSNNSQQHSPQTPHDQTTPADRRSSSYSTCFNVTGNDGEQEQYNLHQGSVKRSSCVSFRSELVLFDLVNGEINDFNER